MTCLSWLLCALLGSAPQVQVETLKSGQITGELQQVTASQVVVGEHKLPLSEVLEIRLAAPTPTPAAAAQPMEVILNDGSQLSGSQITVKGGEVSLQSPDLGTVAVRKNVVKSLRLASSDPKVDEAWQKLLVRESKKDLIIVRKEDKLDFLGGVAGEIDAQTVKFLIDGEEVPVKRERVYGLIFQPAEATIKPQASLDLLGDMKLESKLVTVQGDKCQVVLASGVNVTVPLSRIRSMDFSAGKVRQLSQMKPSDLKFVPLFDDVGGYYDYRKDNGPLRMPISVGGKSYPRGICIHSQSRLTFRLQGDYRRFQSTVGIDDHADDYGIYGNVQLTISGDDKVLLKADVKRADAPKPIDLDVTGVRDLQIFVDFGEDNVDTADWLSMGDAKVIK